MSVQLLIQSNILPDTGAIPDKIGGLPIKGKHITVKLTIMIMIHRITKK